MPVALASTAEVADASRVAAKLLEKRFPDLAPDRRADVVQDAIVDAWSSWRGDAPLSTLAATIALHAAAKLLARQRAHDNDGEDLQAPERDDQETAVRAPIGVARDAREAIRRLVYDCAGHVRASMLLGERAGEFGGPGHVGRYLAKWIAYEWPAMQLDADAFATWLAATWRSDSTWHEQEAQARSVVREALKRCGMSAAIIDDAERAEQIRRTKKPEPPSVVRRREERAARAEWRRLIRQPSGVALSRRPKH